MLTLGYALHPLPGWATVTLDDGLRQVELEAAWSTDVLRHLVRGTADLLDGGQRLRVLLDAETSQAVLLVERDGADVVLRARVRLPGAEPDGPELFRARTSLRALALTVLEAAESVLARHGEAGYLEQWGEHPFPTAELARLRASLA